jgi:hypothetical protein
MLPQILTVDFNESGNIWIVRVRREDGRECQANISPNAFKVVRGTPMGQFMLFSLLSRASVLPEVQPTR